jgi:glycine/D-amino acid oxidase-like deaminating enzyme
VATLHGRPDCCWTATAPHTGYPPLSGSGGADVAVIGAGIVGLTAAYLLASAGLSVAVVEALRVGRQVTGRSTAKITSQHSLIYGHLIETRGIDQAQLYADANRSGARQICDWVIELGIACDLEAKATGYQPLQEAVRTMFGDNVADRVGPIWGIGSDGELRNMYARTAQEGFFVAGGGFPAARVYSQYTAMLIKADLKGLRPTT